MLSTDQIERVILDALGTINDEMEDDEKIDFDANSKLFGVGCPIDSLSLVSLIVDVEGTINSMIANPIALMDDRAVMRKKSPFESVENLKEYIQELLSEQKQ